MTIDDIIKENDARNKHNSAYFNPVTGEGSILSRTRFEIPDYPIPVQWLPDDMLSVPLVKKIKRCGSIDGFIIKHLKETPTPAIRGKVIKSFIRVRCKYDFAYWAYSFVKIKNKDGGEDIRFLLNRPQRRLISTLEDMRIAGKPIRLILLKARQWGGSTAIQIYMAWIQLCHKKGLNSIIVGHVRDTSIEVKGMFTKLIESYPQWLLHDPLEEYTENDPKIKGFEGSQSISIIPARNCKIKVGTAESPEGARGGDSSLAHCTEVAFWKKTDNKTPEQIVKSVCSGVLYKPLTVEVFESTANGSGNFFYNEWERAKAGESDKRPLFIAWYEIDMYTLPIDDIKAFATRLYENKDSIHSNGKYYWWLWEKGATLEAINWYIEKSKGYKDHSDMASEYPSDDIEAFKNTGAKVFDIYKVNELKKHTKTPLYTGELTADSHDGADALKNISFIEDKNGLLSIWDMPDKGIAVSHRYLTVVDIGGRWKGADYSVIAVIDRYWLMYGDKPVIVAQWRGHIDHDLLAWKAAQIASFYNNSLLVIEANTLETKDPARNLDGYQTPFILNQISSVYPHLYARKQSDEDIRNQVPIKYGFHTNISTKPMIISHLIKIIREGAYIERDQEAITEYLKYEKKPNGSFGSIPGTHDDILMTRAIGLYICYCEMPLPSEVTHSNTHHTHIDRTEAIII